MSAVVIPEEHLSTSSSALAQLRRDLNRQPGHTLAWKNLKGHPPRLYVAKTLGGLPWLTISSVVVCKRHLTGQALNDDMTYLYTFRYLLERLSWYARDQGRVLHYTLAHIVRFQIAKLREYEARLRGLPGCQIHWSALHPAGGRIDQPSRIEQLQLADLAASATGAAFNADQYGNTEQRYLTEMAGRLYRRNGNLTSYGLKLHPSGSTTKAAYPWVAAL